MSAMGQKRRFERVATISGLPRRADILQFRRHVSKVPTAGVALSLDHPVGEREMRRDRDGGASSLRVLTGSLRGLMRGFQRLMGQKSVSRPNGWGKLASSFWCDGLIHERLDRRRTANGAADVAAAIQPVDECGQVCV
jgi:hypothetical protein